MVAVIGLATDSIANAVKSLRVQHRRRYQHVIGTEVHRCCWLAVQPERPPPSFFQEGELLITTF